MSEEGPTPCRPKSATETALDRPRSHGRAMGTRGRKLVRPPAKPRRPRLRNERLQLVPVGVCAARASEFSGRVWQQCAIAHRVGCQQLPMKKGAEAPFLSHRWYRCISGTRSVRSERARCRQRRSQGYGQRRRCWNRKRNPSRSGLVGQPSAHQKSAQRRQPQRRGAHRA